MIIRILKLLAVVVSSIFYGCEQHRQEKYSSMERRTSKIFCLFTVANKIFLRRLFLYSNFQLSLSKFIFSDLRLSFSDSNLSFSEQSLSGAELGLSGSRMGRSNSGLGRKDLDPKIRLSDLKLNG